MTSKQNPVELDAYALILHSAQQGQTLEKYMKRVSLLARKRVAMIGKGLNHEWQGVEHI